MALFLSQIEPEIKRELYRRIDISSFDHPSTRANITEPVKADISRHWYSIRKPWIRFTSGALVGKGEKFKGTQIYQEYEEESAMKNVLFGGILNSETFNDSSTPVASNKEPYYRAKKSAFKGSGLRGAFANTYIGERKVPIAGITGITIKNKGSLGSIREAEIKWTCFDDDQFNKLQQLYMTPGITCLLEWGWSLDSKGVPVIMESSFFDFELNPNIPKGSARDPYEHSAIRDKVMSSNGCYDACVGMVNNFDWTFNKESGAYDCTTKITAPGDALLGMELSRGDETVPVTEIKGDTWFKPETFQPYMEKGLEIPIKGLSSTSIFGVNQTINLENDIKNLAAEMEDGIGSASWVGNMLNCTPRSDGEETLDIQKDITIATQKAGTQTTTIGANIRLMDRPEISRYNSWMAYDKSFDEKDFLVSIKNKPKVTGAFWFDGAVWYNDYYVTWAFIEEMLINQFFCPKDASGKSDHKFMMLRSCNVVDLDKVKNIGFYQELAKAHSHLTMPADKKVYESVRIGMNPFLRSADGEVMYIPHHPFSKYPTNMDSFALGQIIKGTGKLNYDGYLRNVLVNIKAITASFKGASTLEDGIKSLLGKMNSASCDYWNLVLQCDELDGGTVLKVIDSNWVDNSMNNIMKDGKTSIEDIPFTFPVYSNNTILSDVNMSSKLPDSLKNAIFLGGSQAKKGKSKDGDTIGKLSDKVIDRYYHFGPDPAVSGSVDEEKEAEKARKKAALKEKEMEELRKLGKEVSDATVQDAISSKARNYIINLLETEDSDDGLEYSQYKNNRILPVDLSMKIDGIAGIYFGNVFSISKLPSELKNKLLFQVKNVTHTVNNDTWTTDVTSLCRITNSTPLVMSLGDQFIDEAKRERKGRAKREYEAEEKRREKAKAELEADRIAKAERAASGKDSNAQAEGIDAEIKAVSGATDTLNVDKQILDKTDLSEKDAAVRDSKVKDGSDTRGDDIDGDKDAPPIKFSDFKSPKDSETDAAEEAKKTYIRIPWHLSGKFVSKTATMDDPKLDLPAMVISESELIVNNEARSEIAKDAEDMYEEFNGITTDGDIEQILEHLNKHRRNNTLIVFLQAFHLYATRSGDSKSGNIFEWYKYEDTSLEEFEKVLQGVEVKELPGITTRMGFRLWNLVTKTEGWNHTFPWGPQGDYETLLYWRPGYTEPLYGLG